MSIAIGPILMLGVLVSWFVATVTLIVLGFRGKALWSSPYCIACKYDLRGRVPEESPNCPECGADLTHPKAVGFLRQGCRLKLIVFGAIVFILPVLLITAAFLILPYFTPVSSSNLQSQSNSKVLTYVQKNPDQPWGWDELAYRIRAGTLSATEVEQALQDLTSYMKAQMPGGWDSPMHWLDDFLKEGYQAGLFSDTSVVNFLDAYSGKTPTIGALPRYQSDQKDIRIDIEFGSNLDTLSWDLGLPIEQLWSINEITIDDEPLNYRNNSSFAGGGYANITIPSLAPGDHEIKVTLDAAYFESSDLIGFNYDKATPDDWPKAIRRWRVSAKQTLVVLGESESPVTLSTAPEMNPGPDGVSVLYVVVQRERGQRRLSLELDVKDEYTGSLSCDIAIELTGEHHQLGFMTLENTTDSRSICGWKQSTLLDDLALSITTANVILTPNPKHVYDEPEIDEVWGEPIVIKDVPIKRYDLPDPDDSPDGD